MEIAIISGKGGTGKSCISAAFATLQNDIVLADCDVDAANLYLIFNPACEKEEVFVTGQKAVINQTKCLKCYQCIEHCRFDAIIKERDSIRILDPLCDGCLLCSRICPSKAISMVKEDKSRLYSGDFKNGSMVYGKLAPGEENSGKLVNKVREKAKQLALKKGHKNTIIDGPPGIGCAVISTITGVDAVVIVTEPTKSGLHDLKRSLIITQGFNLKASVIINKYDINPEMSIIIEKYCQQNNTEVIGKIPFDPLVVKAMVDCKSIIDYAPDSEISKNLHDIYMKIFSSKTQNRLL